MSDDQPSEPGEGYRAMPRIRTSDERAMLTEMLDWYREGVVLKVAGLSDEAAGSQPLASKTSISGLVKHLALVEDGWFTQSFAGEPEPAPWVGIDWEADYDWEFTTAPGEPLADSVALYEAACARSRAVTERFALDDVGADTTRQPFSLRWALVHLLEETARHLGHIDILREQLDGTTGD